MQNNIRISKADLSNSSKIAETEKHCFSVPWSEQSIRDFLSSDGAVCFFAEYDGRFAGYVGMMTVCGESNITNVAVFTQYRNLGIASALIGALVEYAKSIGSEKIMLEVRESNIAAINLYKKHGFYQVGLRKNYYTKPAENAILMDLNIQNEQETNK